MIDTSAVISNRERTISTLLPHYVELSALSRRISDAPECVIAMSETELRVIAFGFEAFAGEVLIRLADEINEKGNGRE